MTKTERTHRPHVHVQHDEVRRTNRLDRNIPQAIHVKRVG